MRWKPLFEAASSRNPAEIYYTENGKSVMAGAGFMPPKFD